MLGDNIRKYRKVNNMSQDELAEKLQVTRQSVSLWETGQTQPSLDSVVALATIFQISTDDLLRGDRLESPGIPASHKSLEQPEEKKKYGWIIAVCLIVIAALMVTVWLLWDRPSDPNLDNLAITVGTPVTTTADAPQGNASTETAPEKFVGSIYDYLKEFVADKGTINGDYCYFSNTADTYGGYRSESFSLYYWGDTDTLEFCLHRVLDDTFSINFWLRVPKEHTGTYEYVSSYYYRESGTPLYEAKGTIEASAFTKNYPLTCSNYIGSADQQNAFMETSRKGICELLACLEQFITVEGLECSFADLGFTKF